jgi:hypothetical protein
VQLLHEQFGALSHAAPQNRAPLAMHFEHVHLRFFARIAKDLLERHRDVTHQVHRIVMHDDLPGQIEALFRFVLFRDRGIRDSAEDQNGSGHTVAIGESFLLG